MVINKEKQAYENGRQCERDIIQNILKENGFKGLLDYFKRNGIIRP